MKQLQKLFCVALLCGLFGSAATAYAPFNVTTVFLVRHAEKQSNAPDALLSEAGHARAQRLAAILAKAGVKAIYTSQVERTKQTAAPLAQALGIPSTTINVESAPGGTQVTPQTLNNYATKITQHAGQTALVVGHSNSVPPLIAKLGVTQSVSIGDTEFDNLFVVTIYASGKAVVAQLKY